MDAGADKCSRWVIGYMNFIARGENMAMNKHHNEIVDNIKTLDEAKELILYLLGSRDHVFNVLLYEYRTPLLLIGGYAEMGQRADFAQENPYFLKIINKNVQKIQRMIESLLDDARFGWYLCQNSLLENFPPEVVDPNPIIEKGIIKIQANIDATNELGVLMNELKKGKEQVKSDTAPINFRASVNENLPTAKFSSAILESIMSDVTWLLSEPYRGDTFIATDSDEQWVKVTFSYSTYSSGVNIREDFQRFENAQTAYEFVGESLFFYNIWRKVRAYGGEVFLNVQEKSAANKPWNIEVTISLKR